MKQKTFTSYGNLSVRLGGVRTPPRGLKNFSCCSLYQTRNLLWPLATTWNWVFFQWTLEGILDIFTKIVSVRSFSYWKRSSNCWNKTFSLFNYNFLKMYQKQKLCGILPGFFWALKGHLDDIIFKNNLHFIIVKWKRSYYWNTYKMLEGLDLLQS